MAMTKDFTDASGNVHTPAYWRATVIDIAAAEQSIALVFRAYKDAASFAAGLQPLPGGAKQYTITGADFLAIAATAPVGATLYDALAHAAEAYALGKLDTPAGPLGSPMVSFFGGAAQV